MIPAAIRKSKPISIAIMKIMINALPNVAPLLVHARYQLSELGGMFLVLLVSHPSQIRDGVVFLVAVNVIDKRIVVRILDKCHSYKAIDSLLVALAVLHKSDFQVSFLVPIRLENAVIASDSAPGADLVVLKAFYVFPYFHISPIPTGQP